MLEQKQKGGNKAGRNLLLASGKEGSHGLNMWNKLAAKLREYRTQAVCILVLENMRKESYFDFCKGQKMEEREPREQRD